MHNAYGNFVRILKCNSHCSIILMDVEETVKFRSYLGMSSLYGRGLLEIKVCNALVPNGVVSRVTASSYSLYTRFCL